MRQQKLRLENKPDPSLESHSIFTTVKEIAGFNDNFGFVVPLKEQRQHTCCIVGHRISSNCRLGTGIVQTAMAAEVEPSNNATPVQLEIVLLEIVTLSHIQTK